MKNKIIKIILVIVFIVSSVLFINNIIDIYHDKKVNTNILDNVILKDNEINDKDILLAKLTELNKQNNDILGWIQIDDTNIDYPVLQTIDNSYYLNHNYLKEESKRGSIFLDKDVDLNTSSNCLIYGHRTSTKLMFEDLINYKDKDFYLDHKIIKFATLEEESEYEIMAVFYSRVYYQNESNIFRYYNYVNLNEEEFNYYVNEAKKSSIYKTDVEATYGDQLLTLSTCEYSKNNGRFVIVAKKI